MNVLGGTGAGILPCLRLARRRVRSNTRLYQTKHSTYAVVKVIPLFPESFFPRISHILFSRFPVSSRFSRCLFPNTRKLGVPEKFSLLNFTNFGGTPPYHDTYSQSWKFWGKKSPITTTRMLTIKAQSSQRSHAYGIRSPPPQLRLNIRRLRARNVFLSYTWTATLVGSICRGDGEEESPPTPRTRLFFKRGFGCLDTAKLSPSLFSGGSNAGTRQRG